MNPTDINFYLIITIYLVIINLISFFAMKIDKNLSIKHKSRISEKTLFTFACIFGAMGIYAGMYAFRHKTKHLKFTVLIPVLIILNVSSLIYFIYILSK